MNALTWMGVAICLSQSAMFSGLNLAVFWSDQKRVITGSDILGRLLRGITRREPTNARAKSEPNSPHA